LEDNGRLRFLTRLNEKEGTSMKRSIAALVFAALFVGFLGFTAPARAICIEVGNPAPDFTLTDLDGKTISLASYKGKAVLLAFWASWCPRCMEELAFLQGIYTGYKNDLVVVAINQDTKNLSPAHVEKLKAELKEMGLEFPIVLDKEFEAWQKFCINALPTSVILSREGKVVWAEPNYYWASQKKIRNVLADMGIGKKVED
jgi:peroxiredoxin